MYMDNPLKSIKLKYKIFIGLAASVFIVAGVYIFIEYELFQKVTALINENTPAELFITLMIFLPLVGVPLSVFIFLLGMKFGLLYGILLLEIMLPIHMLTAYLLAHVVRKPIENYLIKQKNYQLPKVPAKKALVYSFLFLVFPAFPYSVKIYMLPLAGVRFRYCFWLNWAVQGILCIPFVLLGKSAADLNAVMFGITILIFIVMYFFLHWARKQYSALQKEKIS